MIIKTIIPKEGNLGQYYNTRIFTDKNLRRDAIGYIDNAVEIDSGYELTIVFREDVTYEWVANNFKSFSLLYKGD